MGVAKRKKGIVRCLRLHWLRAVPVVAGWKFEHSGMPAAPGKKFSGRSMGRIRAGFGAQRPGSEQYSQRGPWES